MAERPSVKEILERARAAGPAKPEEAEAAPEAPAVPEAAEAPHEAAAPAPAPTAPTPESLGRPLTLKEKLAAARDKPVGAAPAPPARPVAEAAAVPPAAEEAAPAAPPASAAPELTPEALGRPLTLKEKLAAARAGGGTAPAPAGARPAAKPAAAGAAPAAAKAGSTRTLPPLEQMSDPKDLAEALRRAGAAKEKVARAALAEKTPGKAAKRVESKVVPPRPSKAAAEAGQTATAPGTRTALAPEPAASRRGFFGDVGWIVAGWAAFAAAMGSFAAMSLRFFFPNVLAEPPSTIKVGLPTNFEMGEVNENWKAEWGFWIVRSDYYDGEDKIYALSTICTHLGCPPAWLAAEQKFKCPCHGSGYYVSGVNFEGPAPRPLERFKITLGDDGQLVVDKAAKFQEELGQWTDPESYFTA